MAEAYPSSNRAEERGALARERIDTPVPAEASFSDLVGGLVADAQTLVRKEIDLAKEEVKAELGKLKQGALSLAIGGGLALVGGLLLGHMLALAVTDLLNVSPWIGYLIVGAVLAISGGVLLATGLKRMQQIDPMPREAIDSVRKDVEWIQGQSPSDRT